MIEFSRNLSDKITEARKTAGFTQKSFASLLGMSRETSVQNWESGRNTPNLKVFRQIAAVTGRPLSWFFEESDDVTIESVLALAASLHDSIARLRDDNAKEFGDYTHREMELILLTLSDTMLKRIKGDEEEWVYIRAVARDAQRAIWHGDYGDALEALHLFAASFSLPEVLQQHYGMDDTQLLRSIRQCLDDEFESANFHTDGIEPEFADINGLEFARYMLRQAQHLIDQAQDMLEEAARDAFKEEKPSRRRATPESKDQKRLDLEQRTGTVSDSNKIDVEKQPTKRYKELAKRLNKPVTMSDEKRQKKTAARKKNRKKKR